MSGASRPLDERARFAGTVLCINHARSSPYSRTDEERTLLASTRVFSLSSLSQTRSRSYSRSRCYIRPQLDALNLSSALARSSESLHGPRDLLSSSFSSLALPQRPRTASHPPRAHYKHGLGCVHASFRPYEHVLTSLSPPSPPVHRFGCSGCQSRLGNEQQRPVDSDK